MFKWESIDHLKIFISQKKNLEGNDNENYVFKKLMNQEIIALWSTLLTENRPQYDQNISAN